MYKKIKQFFKVCVSAIKEMVQFKFSYRASSLAFSTLLSLVPMVAVFVFIMTKAAFFSDLNVLAKNYVVANFVPTSSNEIITYLDKFTQQASRLPIFSILFLFVTSIFLVISVDDSMNYIWHKQTREKNLIAFLIYPLIVLFIPLFIVLVALLSSFLLYLFNYFPILKITSLIVPWLINAFMLSLLYFFTANKVIHWQDTILGSLVASLLLELSKIFFAIYINQFSNYDAIYGALATIPILLIWLYIFWLIILYGALIVKMPFQNKS